MSQALKKPEDSVGPMQADFLVFGGEDSTSPRGGFRDFLMAATSSDASVSFARGYVQGNGSIGWAYVLNVQTGVEIWHHDRGFNLAPEVVESVRKAQDRLTETARQTLARQPTR